MLYMGSSQINPRMKLEIGDRFRVALYFHTPNTNIYMHKLQGRWLEVASISEHPMNVRGNPCPDFESDIGPVGYSYIVRSYDAKTHEYIFEGGNHWFWYHMDAIDRGSHPLPLLSGELPDI